jgi:hypothetical protein
MSLRGETLPSIDSILEMTCLKNERKYVSVVHPEGPETVTLGDGTTVTVRPICPDDAYRLQVLFTRGVVLDLIGMLLLSPGVIWIWQLLGVVSF